MIGLWRAVEAKTVCLWWFDFAIRESVLLAMDLSCVFPEL